MASQAADTTPGGSVGPPVSGARRPHTPSESELRELLTRHRGNVAEVGREFGRERMQVHRWMQRYNIDAEDFRQREPR